MKLPTHISYVLKKSFYLRSWKSLSCIKFLNWKYFQMKFKYFQIPFHLIKWKKSYHLHSRVLWWNKFEFMEIINARWKFGKVLLFPLIQLSKSFEFHSNSHKQPHHNQANNQNYLFNITFQNLEFWDVTNLPPLKWISPSRFGEARKK